MQNGYSDSNVFSLSFDFKEKAKKNCNEISFMSIKEVKIITLLRGKHIEKHKGCLQIWQTPFNTLNTIFLCLIMIIF